MDKAEADQSRVVDQIRSLLSNRAAPLSVHANDKVVSVFDDLSGLPEELRNAAAEYKEMVLDAVAEADDVVLEKYLSGEEIPRRSLAGVSRVPWQMEISSQ